MKAKEFDIIIDSIEENIKCDWPDVENKLKQQLGMTACDIGSVFKFFWMDDLTLNHYFKARKACRALQAGTESPEESIEEIAYEFGYKEYSTFFRAVQKLYKTNPNEIIEKGDYKAPAVKHAADIVSEDSELIVENRISLKTAGYEEHWRKSGLIDYITEMRDRISDIKKEMRESKDRVVIEGLQEEMLGIERDLEEAEERLKTLSHNQVVINNLTPGLYSEFLTIEGCRSIYGISISKIIELYNKSITEGVPLDMLCDCYSEEEFLEGYDYLEKEYEDEDEWEEEYERFMEEEMNLEESWQYFNNDDVEDPYETIEDGNTDIVF